MGTFIDLENFYFVGTFKKVETIFRDARQNYVCVDYVFTRKKNVYTF